MVDFAPNNVKSKSVDGSLNLNNSNVFERIQIGWPRVSRRTAYDHIYPLAGVVQLLDDFFVDLILDIGAVDVDHLRVGCPQKY